MLYLAHFKQKHSLEELLLISKAQKQLESFNYKLKK